MMALCLSLTAAVAQNSKALEKALKKEAKNAEKKKAASFL